MSEHPQEPEIAEDAEAFDPRYPQCASCPLIEGGKPDDGGGWKTLVFGIIIVALLGAEMGFSAATSLHEEGLKAANKDIRRLKAQNTIIETARRAGYSGEIFVFTNNAASEDVSVIPSSGSVDVTVSPAAVASMSWDDEETIKTLRNSFRNLAPGMKP